MPACPIPVDEPLRQQTLDEMNLLDTPAEHYLDTLVQLTQDRECRLARESHVQLGVIYSDLDYFKAINDQHGHAAGDQVLCECARRLRAALRPDDLLVRQGGEEFVALLKVKDGEELQRVAERVRQLISHEPVQLDCGPLPISLSIGSPCWPARTLSTRHWNAPTLRSTVPSRPAATG